MEKIIRYIDSRTLPNGMKIQVVESLGSSGRHYLMLVDGEQGFHSTDLDRVLRYMNNM